MKAGTARRERAFPRAALRERAGGGEGGQDQQLCLGCLRVLDAHIVSRAMCSDGGSGTTLATELGQIPTQGRLQPSPPALTAPPASQSARWPTCTRPGCSTSLQTTAAARTTCRRTSATRETPANAARRPRTPPTTTTSAPHAASRQTENSEITTAHPRRGATGAQAGREAGREAAEATVEVRPKEAAGDSQQADAKTFSRRTFTDRRYYGY